MDIASLLTSAGINIGICILLFSLYSILRKQPSNRIVYFGRRLASRSTLDDSFTLDRFVPSPGWLVKAWETTEEEILAIGGLDAVVFQRMLVFSIRVFCIAAIVCTFLVLPVNYFGKDMQHKQFQSESLEVFTIGNVRQGSSWLWAHCLALYIISLSACVLLYFEYKSIAKMRLAHITRTPLNPSNFTILVRSIPRCHGRSYSDAVREFFSNYYSACYLTHQMVYHNGIENSMSKTERICKTLNDAATIHPRPKLRTCCLCGATAPLFRILDQESVSKHVRSCSGMGPSTRKNECPAAFVFFKTRYAAVVTSQMLQSSNPMLWVTRLAPEPHDVLWENLTIPYRHLWLRKLAIILAAIVFMFLFLVPVTFVQGLTQLNKVQRTFPFLGGVLKKDFINHLVTGYLPSVILMLALYTVPPTMMMFSSMEGPASRSSRKKSACLKILYFTIWNVFFVNVLSGSVISQLSVFSSVSDIPTQLARAVPTQASFFMTYVLTSGWAGLASELMQLFSLIWNFCNKFICRNTEESSQELYSFPYHTEIPRVLLFGLIGFTCSIMAPLIVPLLLIYFSLAFLVYQNQILNVYIPKYESGGRFWPIIHNTTIFSLVLAQIISLGVFGLKEAPIASGFTIPLIFCTLLFNEYCRQRFCPIFRQVAAEVLIEMDRHDEQCGRLAEIYHQLHSAYSQFTLFTRDDYCESTTLRYKDPEAAANSGRELIDIK